MTRAALLAYIDNNVYPNANNEITALMVRDVLHRMVDFLGDAATYGVGDVALNNGGLVTGGAVQSAINTTLSSAIMFQGVTTTPLTDGSTNPNITIGGESYTAHRGDEVIYGGKEFLWTGTKWQQLGDEESWAAKTITISAGTGLTGGGNLTQNRTISLSQDSLEKLALAASAYQLPQGGIPKTDLASAVQNSLGKADTVAGYFSNDKLNLQNLPALYVARTQVSGTAANKTLYGVDGISAAAAADANDKSLIEWDSTNSAWHFHGNIYTDGWFSGGGISSGGGGGGGGIDPVAMWRLLTNDPSLTQYDNYTKISADHINFPVTSVVGLTGAITAQQIAQGLNLGSYAYKNSLLVSDIPDLSGTYLPLTGGTLTGTLTTPRLSLTGVGSSFRGGLYPANEISGVASSSDLFIYNSGQVMIYGTNTILLGLTTLANNTYFSIFDTSGTARGVLWLTGNNLLDFGRFTAEAGYNTAIYGNNISFYYGTSKTLGLSITSLGDIMTSNYFNGPVFRTSTSGSDSSGVWRGSAWSSSLGDGDMVVSAYGHRLRLHATNIELYAPTSLYRDDLNGHEYTIWDANNSNNSGVDWICSELTADRIKFAPPANAVIGQKWSTGDSNMYSYIRFIGYGNPNFTTYGRGLGIEYISGTWTSGGSEAVHRFIVTQDVVALAICNNGNVGVKTSSPGYDFDVAGVIHATTGIYTDGWFSGGGLASSSDRRLKKNIKNFGYTPELLLAIRPREWDWKDGSAMVGHAAGFVAQEIEPVMPYAVDGTRNFKALFYDRFHALEVSALQDHERRIVDLERAVKERDKKIEKLEKMLKLN